MKTNHQDNFRVLKMWHHWNIEIHTDASLIVVADGWEVANITKS